MTLLFAVKIVEFTEKLEESRKYVIAKQILRSGTSIGASVREAQNAESKADFIHKMKIVAKEADELRSNHEYHKNIKGMSRLIIGFFYAKKLKTTFIMKKFMNN